MQFKPSLDEMRALRDQGNLCPIYAEILADLETPVSAFLKVARGPWSFLLESVEGGQHLARYSFIGAEPYMTLRFADGARLAPGRVPPGAPARPAALRRRRGRLPELRDGRLLRAPAAP